MGPLPGIGRGIVNSPNTPYTTYPISFKRDQIGVFDLDYHDTDNRGFITEGKDLIFIDALSFVERL